MTPSTCCHPNLEFGFIAGFCSCWVNFIISLKEKGDGILHPCSASPCFLGQFTASRLNFIRGHFQIDESGVSHAFETSACCSLASI